MTVVTEQEIARYVERVRAALADLAPAARDELLEDLPEHLAEVAAEADGSLTERLGPPEAYAAELRTAAGVSVPVTGPNLDQRIGAAVVSVRGRLRAMDGRLGPVIGYAKASDFLRLLRPAWWVLRGYLAAMFITVVLTGQSFGLLPRLGGSSLGALLLLTVTVVGSIWLGRRSGGFTRWPKLLLYASTGLIVLFGLVGFVDADDRARSEPFYSPSSNSDPYAGLQDIFVYDGQGRLVENARLFDQNGQPIRLGDAWCGDAEPQNGSKQMWPAYPYCPQNAPFRIFAPPLPPGATPSSTVEPTPSGSAQPTSTPVAPPPAPTVAPGRPPAATTPPLSTPTG